MPPFYNACVGPLLRKRDVQQSGHAWRSAVLTSIGGADGDQALMNATLLAPLDQILVSIYGA